MKNSLVHFYSVNNSNTLQIEGKINFTILSANLIPFKLRERLILQFYLPMAYPRVPELKIFRSEFAFGG